MGSGLDDKGRRTKWVGPERQILWLQAELGANAERYFLKDEITRRGYLRLRTSIINRFLAEHPDVTRVPMTEAEVLAEFAAAIEHVQRDAASPARSRELAIIHEARDRQLEAVRLHGH